MFTTKTILAIISSVLSLVQFFASQAKSRDDNEAGQLTVALAILSQARKDLDLARGIETTITNSISANHDLLHKPDEFTVE